MNLLSLVGISDALAEAAAPSAQASDGSFLSILPMLAVFLGVFYFLLIRPQQKRAKEHQKLMSDLAVGDEVVTAGGIIGKLTKLRDKHVVVQVSEGTEIVLQRASVVPKGTLETVG